MPFDPRNLVDIPDSERAQLTRELGAQTKRDAHETIVTTGLAAMAGDDDALRTLTASAAASLAVALLAHVGQLCTDDPCGEEIRAMLSLIPGARPLVTLAALHGAFLAYADVADSPLIPPAELAARKAQQRKVAEQISACLWQDVRDFMRTAKQNGSGVGTRVSATGSNIFVVPPGPLRRQG